MIINGKNDVTSHSHSIVAGGFGGYVISDAVDAAHLVDDAARHLPHHTGGAMYPVYVICRYLNRKIYPVHPPDAILRVTGTRS
jgi:hypothetical protein